MQKWRKRLLRFDLEHQNMSKIDIIKAFTSKAYRTIVLEWVKKFTLVFMFKDQRWSCHV